MQFLTQLSAHQDKPLGYEGKTIKHVLHRHSNRCAITHTLVSQVSHYHEHVTQLKYKTCSFFFALLKKNILSLFLKILFMYLFIL